MSTIENQNVPQKSKPYKEYSQDHGDAAQKASYRGSAYLNEMKARTDLKKEAEFHQAGLEDADYRSMSPSELEDEADRLLNEPSAQDSSFIESVRDTFEEANVSYDDEIFGDLLDKHQSLLRERAEILESINIDDKDFEHTLEQQSLVDSITEDLDTIEEEVVDLINERTSSHTEVEFGVKSKREITREMARRATLDPSEDDDHGDSDYGSPIRIKNRL